METAYFRNIRKELIESLSLSHKEIRVAVAWFTNQDLFDTLISCLERGVKTSLIIIDDYINNGDYGLNFQYFINKGGILLYGKEENPMHHKFCTIDDNILWTGSYNWTYYAEHKNHENIVKFKDSNLVQQYIQEFDILKENLNIVQDAHKVLFENYENSDIFSMKNYIGLDLTYKAKETSDVKYLQEAIKLLPENKIVKREYQEFNPLPVVEQLKPKFEKQQTQPIIIPKVKKTVNSIGIECINNRFAIIVPKETAIPCKLSDTFYTVYDNQTSISVKTFKGENPLADKNIRLGQAMIKDIPPKPAGKASITITILIDSNLRLTVRTKSNDTGNEIEADYYDKEIAK